MHKTGVHIYSNTPQSQHSCVCEGFVCRVGATVQRRRLRGAPAVKQKGAKAEECHGVVPKAEQELQRGTGWGLGWGVNFQCWWSRGEGVKVTIQRIVLNLARGRLGRLGRIVLSLCAIQ